MGLGYLWYWHSSCYASRSYQWFVNDYHWDSPFITTLGMQLVCQGCAKLTSAKTIAPLDKSIKVISRGFVFDTIPVSVVLLIVLYALMAFMINGRMGRYYYELVQSREAYFAGINIISNMLSL